MIQFTDVTFSYQRNKHIFEALNIHFDHGKIYGLLGENGVGKTTFLRMTAGLLFPKRGTIDVMDFVPKQRNPDFLASLFYLPEEFDAPHEVVKDFVQRNGSFYPSFNKDQFTKYMDQFGVEPNKKFTELSFGQKKKTLISMALSVNTPILLLDEPTNGLDIPSKTIFRRLIAQVADEKKCIIISTHQVRDLELLIDPIVILERNQVLLNDSVESITQKLMFSVESVIPPDALYYEPTPGGYNVISINQNGIESKLNIELLFNAVIANRAYFKNVYPKTK
ncbi:MAG: ATP-binding cassette domain-containing protein [Microbacter sp.]